MSHYPGRLIAVFLLSGLGIGAELQAEEPCERLSHYAGAFIGGATGAGVAVVAGSRGWISAGLVGMGSAAGYDLGKTGSEVICRNAADALAAINDLRLGKTCYTERCKATRFANSLAQDFALCVGCSIGTVMNGFFMEDKAREAYLRRMSAGWSKAFAVIPRNDLMTGVGTFDATGAFYSGMEIGTLEFQVVMTLER